AHRWEFRWNHNREKARFADWNSWDDSLVVLAVIRAAHSVETVSCAPLRAARSACQARVAHLTRAGYAETPPNTESLPRSDRSPQSALTRPVTMSWNLSNSFSISALVLPFTLCVIMDAEALEIAQPEP